MYIRRGNSSCKGRLRVPTAMIHFLKALGAVLRSVPPPLDGKRSFSSGSSRQCSRRQTPDAFVMARLVKSILCIEMFLVGVVRNGYRYVRCCTKGTDDATNCSNHLIGDVAC
jgi:hypothetical protein